MIQLLNDRKKKQKKNSMTSEMENGWCLMYYVLCRVIYVVEGKIYPTIFFSSFAMLKCSLHKL